MRIWRMRCLRRQLSWRRFIICLATGTAVVFMLPVNWLVISNSAGPVAAPHVALRKIYHDTFGNVLQVEGNIVELSKDYSELNQKTQDMRRNRHKKKTKSLHRNSKLTREQRRTLKEKQSIDSTKNIPRMQFPNLTKVFLETKQLRTKGAAICGKGWQEKYIRLHKRILKSKEPRQFLVYSCKGEGYGCAGYGNRLGGITALFLIAVLTNRAFLIDWEYSKPLALRNFFQPNKIKWDYSVSNLQGLDFRMHYWGKGFPKKLRNTTLERPGNVHPEFLNWFRNTNLEEYLSYPVEQITAVWNFAHAIWYNPLLARKASDIGLKLPSSRYSTVGCVYDLLFKTTPEFEKRLNYARDILKKKANAPMIGLHIRMGDSVFGRRHKYNTHDFKRFFTCAHTVENQIVKYNSAVKASNIRWFLASDSAIVKEYASKEFGAKIATLKMVPEHIGIFQKQRQPSVEGMYGVLLDHFLLSESDYIILSNSTFGVTALGRTYHAQGSYSYGERCGTVYKSWHRAR